MHNQAMNILVIDGQGGKLGAQLIKETAARFPDAFIMAVGTNSIAAAAMVKAGATAAATGENAVAVACRKADVIIGPVGIVIADSMHGEVTPVMAAAVGQSPAVRILLPVNRCDNIIAGIKEQPVSSLIDDTIAKLAEIIAG